MLRMGRTNSKSDLPQRMALGTCKLAMSPGSASASRSTVGRPFLVMVTIAQGSFFPAGCSKCTAPKSTPHFSANFRPWMVGLPASSTHMRWGGPT
jgi:hypothetical protein